MGVTQEHSELQTNLTALREHSLTPIALFVGTIGYTWLVSTMIRLDSNRLIVKSAWLGSALLLLGASVGLVLKRGHLRLAAHLLVWSTLGAAACALLTFPSPATMYLFILPITFASALLSQPAFLCVTGLAGFSALTIGMTHIAGPLPLADVPLLATTGVIVAHFVSSELAPPVTTTLLVATTLWLSAHSLRTALTWVWNGYEHARRNEQIARDRQAELKRALKALDEASYRLERANYMLALARDQAEEARRLKQQFAQTISHELRTPLNLIVGFTELMAGSPEYYGGPLVPAYLRDLGIVYRNACHLQALVNDVLDLARIEAAQMSLVLEQVDPEATVREAVDTARSLVEARGLALHTVIEPGLPGLWLDPTRIRQVLFNLLNNAARFTERGRVTVSVRRLGQDVLFGVSDTGVGIAPEDIPRIFKEFQQADGGTQRQHGGAGLGLAISRKFVELHGGHIWAESRVGQGSTFTFSLPIDHAGLDLEPGRHEAHSPRTASLKESEEPVLLAVTRSLSAATLLTHYVHAFRTVAVSDLKEARRMAGQLSPQVVLIDRACTEVDQEALEELARAWGLARTPFILCPLPGEELLRRRLAVDGYLIKPVSRQNLWDLLRQFGEGVDRVLVVDDDQDFVLFLSRILEDSPVRRYQVTSAYTGQEALALLDHRPPDLMLLDLMLPDIDGAQIIERMRANPAWRHIPILVVSAQDESDYRASLPGAMAVAKASGLTPGEVVQWVQHVADTAVRLSTTPGEGNQRKSMAN